MMRDPLFGLDPSKGMFSRYRAPMHSLCILPGIFEHPNTDLLTHLISEGIRRLRQLDRFYQEAWDWVHEAVQPVSPDPLTFFVEADKRSRAMDHAGDAAEAFYVFGFRLLDITRKVCEHGGFSQLKPPEPQKFRNVRNFLIIHPEKDAEDRRVLSWSLYVTNKDNRGVVIKNKRREQEKKGHNDPGLGPNAVEFQRYLEAWIVSVSTGLQSSPKTGTKERDD